MTDRPDSYAVGPAARSYRAPGDALLRDLTDVLDRIRRDTDASPESVLLRVASGLTGDLNGYRERALARAWADTYTALTDAPLADLKAAEQARRR